MTSLLAQSGAASQALRVELRPTQIEEERAFRARPAEDRDRRVGRMLGLGAGPEPASSIQTLSGSYH